MSAFERALSAVLEAEGGYINDPADPGGATNKGITQGTYDEWREDQSDHPRPVAEIEQREVEAIYFERYWREGKCDQLPDLVSLAHFDGCVNIGVYGAALVLQRAAQVEDDGIIGPITLGAVAQVDPDALFDTILWERLRYYRDITVDEANALVEMARAVREERWPDVAELVNKAEGLKFIRWWIKRLLDLRGGI